MSNVNCMLLYTKCVSKQMSAWIGVKHLAVKEPHDEIYSYTYIKKWRPPHILKQGCCSSRKSPYTCEVPTVRPRKLMVLEDCSTFLLGMVPFQGAIFETPRLYTLLFLNLTSVVSQPGKSDVYCKCQEDSEIWGCF